MAYIDCKKCSHYKVCIMFTSEQAMEEVSKVATEIAECLPCDLYLPAVDVVEVKYGEWKPDYETFVDDLGIESEPIITGWICSLCAVSKPYKSHYCPNCGAKMDERSDI